MMRLFAELISLQLRAEEEHERDRQAIVAEREATGLREQFLAVLAHDIRTPLTAMMVGASTLLLTHLQPRQRTILERVARSGERMAGLIDDVLDLARGRLGGGR